MGGVGKTNVCVEYAYRYSADYDVVWCIDAGTVELVAGQFGPLGLAMGVDVDPTADPERIA